MYCACFPWSNVLVLSCLFCLCWILASSCLLWNAKLVGTASFCVVVAMGIGLCTLLKQGWDKEKGWKEEKVNGKEVKGNGKGREEKVKGGVVVVVCMLFVICVCSEKREGELIQCVCVLICNVCNMLLDRRCRWDEKVCVWGREEREKERKRETSENNKNQKKG